MSLAEDRRRVVLQWIEYAIEGRFDDLMALGASDTTWWISGLKETTPYNGTYPCAERDKHLKELLKEALSFEFAIKVITTEGDSVVVEGAPRAEAQDGRIYVNDVMIKCVVKDGKIQSVREYVDFFVVLKFMEPKGS